MRLQNAIPGGAPRDASAVATELGISCPVALTQAAWKRCVAVPPGAPGRDEGRRLWDVLVLLRFAIRTGDGSRVVRYVVQLHDDDRGPQMVPLLAVCGPGRRGEPAITVMLADEG